MQPETTHETWKARPRTNVGGLSAIVAGTGPLLVLLHGVGLRAEAWSPVVDALSAEFTVVAPDMPGHGESPLIAPDAALVDFVRAAAPVLDRPAIVAGHSMGAMIALALADHAPTKVRAVLALNAIFERDETAKAAVKARAAALDGTSVADPGPTLTRWFGAAPSPERLACNAWLTSVDPLGYRTAYTVFAKGDGPSRAALAALDQPALFATGADDPNSTPEMATRMAALCPNGQVQVTQGAAHMLPMTHPMTVVAALKGLARMERT